MENNKLDIKGFFIFLKMLFLIMFSFLSIVFISTLIFWIVQDFLAGRDPLPEGYEFGNQDFSWGLPVLYKKA